MVLSRRRRHVYHQKADCVCVDRSKLPPESVARDWLDPRECVLQVFNMQQHDESVHELFCAIRINVVLRSRYSLSLIACTVPFTTCLPVGE